MGGRIPGARALARAAANVRGAASVRGAAVVLLAAVGLLAVPLAAQAESEAEQALMAADSAFAAQSMQEGRQAAFLHWMGDGATMFREGAAPLEGRPAIEASVAKWPPLTLDWQPRHAQVAASGELGYTWGEYQASGHKADGSELKLSGRYVTIWRKDPGGQWRWVVDIGN